MRQMTRLKHSFQTIALLIVILFASGCAMFDKSQGPSTKTQADKQSKKELTDNPGTPTTKTEHLESQVAMPGKPWSGDLSLRDAMVEGACINPDLILIRAMIRKTTSERISAGIKENPELELEGEANTEDTEDTAFELGVDFPLLRGDKIKYRKALVEARIDALEIEYELRKWEIRNHIRHAYRDITIRRERIDLIQAIIKENQQILQVATNRQKRGEVSDIDLNQIELSILEEKQELESLNQDYREDLNELSKTMNYPLDDSVKISTTFPKQRKIEKLETLIQLYDRMLQARLANAEIDTARRALALEKANAKQDWKIGAFYLRENEDDVNSGGIRLSIPLPWRDRNQGGIAEANAELAGSIDQARAKKQQFTNELRTSYKKMITRKAYLGKIETANVSKFKEFQDNVEKAYAQGKAEIFEVMQVRLQRLRLGQQVVDAREGYYQSLSELEQLLGDALLNQNPNDKE